MNKKQEIIARLFKEDKITLEEMLILLEKEPEQEIVYIPYQQPYTWISPPYYVTYDTTITTNNS